MLFVKILLTLLLIFFTILMIMFVFSLIDIGEFKNEK